MADRYDTQPGENEQLPNKLGLTDQELINSEEAVGFLRAEQQAIDALTGDTIFTLEYLYALHRAALESLYDFAGHLRTVNMSKGGFMFAAAQFLPQSLETFKKEYLDPISAREWDDASLLDHLGALHAELLYIHPFREGNGRIIRLFARLIFLAKWGAELDFELITQGDNYRKYIEAVQQAARGNYTPMRELFRQMHP